MWDDPQHGRLYTAGDLADLVRRVQQRASVIVAGPTAAALDEVMLDELHTLSLAAHEPAVLIAGSHEAGPGIIDLYARVLKNLGTPTGLVDKVFDTLDESVDWQARHGVAA